jgi:hypothetical protein
MKIHGREYTRRDVLSRVGRMEQIGGARRLRMTEGPEDGTEVIEVRTGAGMEFDVHPGRGMDVGRCELFGGALAWLSSAGAPHPAFHDPTGKGWLRTAAGGLLMTCGLSNAGPPCTDDGEAHGIHGRAHHTPARGVAAFSMWNGDEHDITIRGEIRETRLFGENLVLRREIAVRLGENRIRIRDEVTNEGFKTVPLMLLYHFNFGYPLMDQDTVIRFPSHRVEPREGETPLEGYNQFERPQADYRERVYYHDAIEITARNGRPWAQALLRQSKFPLGPDGLIPIEVRLGWTADTLPSLVEWKMPGAGIHVLGIEPANCNVAGRSANREAHTLQFIEPMQRIEFGTELEVVAGQPD